MPYAALDPDCQALTRPRAGDLERAAAHMALPGLIVFDYEFESLEAILPFNGLQILKIRAAPRLRGLDGIERLSSLRELVISAPPSERAAPVTVESFAVLERATTLRRLILHGVRPADLDLAPVARMRWLEELDITGVPEFGIEHYAKLAAALPDTGGRSLQPYVTIPGIGRCRKCNGRSVLLNGAPPRARKWVCPTCNAKILGAHVARWEALTGRPFSAP
jgi:hypothetical protein